MKNKRRFQIRILLIALFLAALPPNTAAADSAASSDPADPAGRLAFMLDDEIIKEIPSNPKMVLSLYQIGDINPVGNDWRMKEGFTDYGVLEASTTSDMVKIATKMAGEISGKGVTEQTVTLSGGRGVLSDLPLGIYLGMLKSGPAGVTVDPFIISIPNMEDESEIILDYAVTLKAAYKPPQTTTPPKKTTTPPKRTTTPPKKSTSSSTTPRTVKTGDENQTLLWALIMMISLAGFISLMKRTNPRRAGRNNRKGRKP